MAAARASGGLGGESGAQGNELSALPYRMSTPRRRRAAELTLTFAPNRGELTFTVRKQARQAGVIDMNAEIGRATGHSTLKEYRPGTFEHQVYEYGGLFAVLNVEVQVAILLRRTVRYAAARQGC